ncbi:hypothetical protein [Terrabacter sp. Soil810]|uniref:hypothetical protein n=1 Tax=Terrabacter sp. Soil810 TaxID=1736418 RepID=UPI00070C0316|nr:hypothetical protein [Terrabacter sp. Soil810]KRF40190.1 hypothetical protein ASG96_04575 [Terrabacter sp. Soil810]
MTTPDQENELQALLRQHAGGIEVSGDFAPVAIARRRRDRRNRAVLGAAAAVAVIAVAVPTVWSAGRGTPPVPALTTSSTSVPSSPSSVPTQTPSVTTGTGTVAPPTSAPPLTSAPPTATGTIPPSGTAQVATRGTAYALDDTIRFGDKVFRLQKGTAVETFAVLGNGGFVVASHMSDGPSQSIMEILSPGGRLVTSLGVSGTYAVSPDGSRVLAKSGDSDTVVVYAADGSKVAQRTDDREPGAIVGDLAYLTGDTTTGSLEWDVATGTSRKLPAHVVAVSPDRSRAALQWFVATDAMDEACWAVVDLTRSTFPKTVERCGAGQNPTMFMPTAFSSRGTYLVGSHYLDGGFWFSAGVVRVSDGTVVLGGTGDRVVSGWTWHLGDDESTLVISRNTSKPLTPAARNTVQRCTLAMDCSVLHPEIGLSNPSSFTEPRYVVPR